MAQDDPQLDKGEEAQALEAGDEPEALESGEDLAQLALDEAEESDKLAETLTSLQNLIERRALQVEAIKEKLSENRSMLRDVYTNDETLTDAQEEQKAYSSKVRERKSQINSSPEAMSIKTKIAELREEQKELEETLSNHLVNYHSMTNSNSFDTSDGDQWEFSIKAKIKARKKS
jgi:hypothetical protein